jgi:hypothetical protein
LTKAQRDIESVRKNAINPFLKSKYADLASIVEAIKEPLAENELSYSQFPISEGNQIGTETILIHSSGEWISGSFLLPQKPGKEGLTPQTAGSSLTYARRYSIMGILGLSAEDDDGHAASQGRKQQKNLKDLAFKDTKAKMIKAFNDLDITTRSVLDSIGVQTVDEVNDTHITTLKAAYTAVKDNPENIPTYFPVEIEGGL